MVTATDSGVAYVQFSVALASTNPASCAAPTVACYFKKAILSILEKPRQLTPTIDLEPFCAFEGMCVGMYQSKGSSPRQTAPTDSS